MRLRDFFKHSPQQKAADQQASIDLSIVVVAFNMARELPRTISSLSPSYQKNVHEIDYEIIVVDNGSDQPISESVLKKASQNVRLIKMENPSRSPAAAINRGLAEAKGEVIGVMIDGARLVTPGFVHFCFHGAKLYPKSVVATLGWYLGYDIQRFSMRAGYDKKAEDALLKKINWPNDGYRLFEIATPDDSSWNGWLAPIAESNGLFLNRETWDEMNGADERFDQVGGGLLNLDTFSRAMNLPGSELVIPLSEGTFHQLHGGISTNTTDFSSKWGEWENKYRNIRHKPYTVPAKPERTTYIGILPQIILDRFIKAAYHPLPHHPNPFGSEFQKDMFWSSRNIKSKNTVVSALVNLAQSECSSGRLPAAAAIARLAKQRFPNEPEIDTLLQSTAGTLVDGNPPAEIADGFYAAIGDAYRVLVDNDLASKNYKEALRYNRDFVRAHIGLAEIGLPGDFYYDWIKWFYNSFGSKYVLEIGVFEGQSLALVKPPAVAIGVDPTPKLLSAPSANVHIFSETSDDFFVHNKLQNIVGSEKLDIVFIDGLHLFEQCLKDFVNAEKWCSEKSIILFHDTIPLDEATQSRKCDTQFHTGDVWKIVPCLKYYRPDLDIFTIACPWTGLTVVSGLNPKSTILSEKLEEATSRFIDLPFDPTRFPRTGYCDVLPNSRAAVAARLKALNLIS